MNKLLITLCLAASFMLSGCYNSGEPREKVLKIYNWADYIGDGVLEDFQAYYKEADRRGYSYCLSNFRYQRNHVDQDRKRARRF